MDHGQFWALIDAARAARAKTSTALARALAKLPAEDIVAFDAWFWAYNLATTREDLWAAVSAIRGSCSDDAFDYFRGWLISRGEEAVLSAVRDPESLATTIGRADPRDEGMISAAREAHREAGHGELPDRGATVEIPGRAEWPADRIPVGTKFTDEFLAQQYPDLHAKFVAAKKPKAPRAAAVRVEKATIAADLTRDVRTYSASDAYTPADRVVHPTFGEGVVEVAEPGKVTVFFATGRRVLVQSKAGAVSGGPMARPKPFDHSNAAGGKHVGES
jgi:hypothetical protein